jgi:cell division septation protein DedD
MAINDIVQRLKKLEQEVNRIKNKNETPRPQEQKARLPKREDEKKNILTLREKRAQSPERREAAKKVYGAPAAQRKALTHSVLNATARRLLSATCHGTVFITFHSYQIPTMDTLTDELREEEKFGGFSANDPTDDTFMTIAPPEVTQEIKTVIDTPKPSVAKQTIDVAKLREPQPAPKLPQSAAPLAPEIEVQREGLKWVRILVLSGVSILFAMVILAWFLVSRSSPSVETKHIVQFSPAEPPSQTVQQPAPTVQEPQPAAVSTGKPTNAATKAEHGPASQRGVGETTTPSENVIENMVIDGHYEIQTLATPSRTEAEQRVASLKAQGANAFVSATMRNNIDFFRVRIGNYTSEREARSAAQRLGLRSSWIEKVQ